MIVTKENGTAYTNGLTKAVIDWHIDNNMTICEVNRPLIKDEDNKYIDDITIKEIEKGYESIRSFMYKEVTDPMFFKVQRGEIEEAEWLNAIQEIKDTYKYKG
jgi:hypothetical protein